jgi:VanZ family protein
VVAYSALIWTLSARTLDIKLDRFPFHDKGVHFLEYGLLAFLMSHAVQVTWPRARRRALAAFWLTVSLGLSDELHQAYVPGRNADALDLLADAIGALTAVLLYQVLRGLWRRRIRARLVIEAPRERSSEESL